MNINFIIFGVLALLAIVLVVAGIAQRREQIAAEKRQKAAQLVYQARNAQDILHNMRGIPVNPQITSFILKVISKNFQAAAALVPSLPNIQQDIGRAMMHQQGYKAKPATAIELPTDEFSLKVTLGKLKKLQRYLKTLNTSYGLDNEQFQKWAAELESTTHRYEIDSLMKLSMRAVEAVKPGTAKGYFETIKMKLSAEWVDDSYREPQLTKVVEMEEKLTQAVEEKLAEETKLKEDENGSSINDSSDLGEKKKW